MYYVVQVYTGKEQETIDDIVAKLEHPEEYDIFSPSRKTLRKYHGEMRTVTERCFPGYVFVETDKPYELFVALYRIPSYARLLGREKGTTNFAPLTPDEVRMIEILYGKDTGRTTPISGITFEEGNRIRILDGPLRDLESKIVKMNLHKRKVTVEVTLCNRTMTVDVGIDIITKVPDDR